MRNNLIFYGVPQEERETPERLLSKVPFYKCIILFIMFHINTCKVKDLLRAHLKVARDVGVQSVSRLYTGPEVQGCRPVLVTFENFKDKEDVFQASKLLRKSIISVTEDFSKKTRESRQELRKFMRHVKKTNPEKRCHLQYDKLYIDGNGKIFLYNDMSGQVEEMGKNTSNSRYNFSQGNIFGNNF